MTNDAARWGWDADTIRALQVRLGLTNEAFAVVLGVTLRTVQRWRNGEDTPSPLAREKLDKIAETDASAEGE